MMLLILVFIIAVLLFLSLRAFKKPPVVSSEQLKGQQGEAALIASFEQYFRAPHLLINNATFYDEQGGTTQIDHILLSPFGIFVIETKNYRGQIFGKEHEPKWTQRLGQNSYLFQNPLRQNYKHIRVLQDLLQPHVKAELFYSVVVFTQNSQIKTPMPPQVCQGQTWVDYVQSFKTQHFSRQDIKRIQHLIQKKMLPQNSKTDRLHVKNLQKKFAKNA